MHSRRINLLSVLLFLLLFIQCSKEEKTIKDNVVKVKDAVLTEEEINNALGEYQNQAKHREEFIRDWIETEVLYQEAVKKGITNEKEYNSTLDRSRKELAASLLINNVLTENSVSPTIGELKQYYESYKDDFRLLDNSYKINVVDFSNFDKAVQFRNTLIESDWNKALNSFRGDPTIVNTINGQIYSEYQLQPLTLLKVVTNLIPYEVSIVLETEPMKFIIVQLVEKLNKGNIPPFEVIQENVKERYQIFKNKEYVQQYINKLLTDYNTDIKR